MNFIFLNRFSDKDETIPVVGGSGICNCTLGTPEVKC